MRRVDSLVGWPLCVIATFLRHMACLARSRPSAAPKPRSVLIIKLSEIGALVTLEPALRRLTRQVGRQNLYFLSFGESRDLLGILDLVPEENVMTLRTDSLATLTMDAIRALRRIRRTHIDCSLDFDFFSRATALLGFLSGCRQRVGCHAYFGEGPWRGDLLTHRIKFNPHVHVSQMFEAMAWAIERPAGDFPRMEFVPGRAEAPRTRFKTTGAEKESLDRLLARNGAEPSNTLVLLNPNISDRESIPLRKWPDEHYVRLARLILEGIPEAFILLTGAPKEADTVARLEAAVGHARCRSVAGMTTFRELLGLYDRSVLIVTNDSGPAHFSTLTNIEVVVLFGPETPLMWRPLGDRVTVIYRGLACSPCFTAYNGRQSMCRRNICMEIPPEEVYEAVQRRLTTRNAPS